MCRTRSTPSCRPPRPLHLLPDACHGATPRGVQIRERRRAARDGEHEDRKKDTCEERLYPDAPAVGSRGGYVPALARINLLRSRARGLPITRRRVRANRLHCLFVVSSVVGARPPSFRFRSSCCPPRVPRFAQPRLGRPFRPSSLRRVSQPSESATRSSRSIPSRMPASIPEAMCASRASLLACSTRTVRVVRPPVSAKVTVFSASASGMPS